MLFRVTGPPPPPPPPPEPQAAPVPVILVKRLAPPMATISPLELIISPWPEVGSAGTTFALAANGAMVEPTLVPMPTSTLLTPVLVEGADSPKYIPYW